MAMYALGTAACAFAPNMATLVVVPHRRVARHRRRMGGRRGDGGRSRSGEPPRRSRRAALHRCAGRAVSCDLSSRYQIQGVLLRRQPEVAWRYVFLFGLVPAAVAFLVRLFVKEPERWENAASKRSAAATDAELFTPRYRAITISGFLMAVVALITWWSCNAFIPCRGHRPCGSGGSRAGSRRSVRAHRKLEGDGGEHAFNLGGLIGTLLTVPASKFLGRRTMFAIYFLASGLSVLAAFGFRWIRTRGCTCISRSA